MQIKNFFNFILFLALLISATSSVVAETTDLDFFPKKPKLEFIEENYVWRLQDQKNDIAFIFYANWCSSCKSVLNIINQLYKEDKEKYIEVIGINIDNKRDEDNFREITKNFLFKNFMLANANVNNIEEPFYIPYILRVRDNKIIDYIGGSADESEIINFLDKKTSKP